MSYTSMSQSPSPEGNTDASTEFAGELQFKLGLCYEHGIGVEKDMNEAVSLYKLAVNRDNADAKNNLGMCYEHGRGVKKDPTEAVCLYELAVNQGHVYAQTNLGICCEQGRGVEKDVQKAVCLYQLAVDQGDARAQTNLGVCYEHGRGVEKDLKEAVRLYKLAVDQGNARAQTNLGLCFKHGHGVEKDVKEAVRLYKLAVDQGDAYAQANLSFCYKDGRGVEKDLKEAVRLLVLAVDQGNDFAQTNLGRFYERGIGVEKDMREAVRLYRLAVDQGNPRAQNNLGVCYEHGSGVEKNVKEAVRLYKLAVDQGNARAQINLGLCYEHGCGVEKDVEEAFRLYELAEQRWKSAKACRYKELRVAARSDDSAKRVRQLERENERLKETVQNLRTILGEKGRTVGRTPLREIQNFGSAKPRETGETMAKRKRNGKVAKPGAGEASGKRARKEAPGVHHRVEVPEDKSPGDQFRVSIEDGRLFDITVPEGVAGGGLVSFFAPAGPAAPVLASPARRALKDQLGDALEALMALKGPCWKGHQNPFLVQITRCNCAELGIPHYFACVSEAMDLTTMSEKLYGNLYKSVDQFAEDVRRIASNAKTFNPPGGPMFLFADRLLATLDDEIRKIAPRSTITEEQKG